MTPDARAKTHFVIVDCVGVSDVPLADTQPLDRKRTVSFQALLEHVAMGGTDPAMLSSLAGRLARLDRQCDPDDRRRIAEASRGASIRAISHAIVAGLDPDRQIEEARSTFDLPAGDEPTEQQLKQAAATLLRRAAEPLATRPALRRLLQDLKRQKEQLIDDISVDELIAAGASDEDRWKAKSLITSFEQFIADNRDEIDAIQLFLPHAVRPPPALRRSQGVGRQDHGAAPSLDARKALARLRDDRQGRGPRRVRATPAHRPRLPRALRAGPG